jgi:NAD(P)-dependent dehydrogenase (short-subunit alcohol dehydrogenase family)
MVMKTAPSILITGANRGIGRELALCCAKNNWSTHATYRTLPPAISSEIDYFQMDVTLENQVCDAMAALKERMEHLDVLVHNAGVFPEPTDAPFEALKPEWWEQTYQTHVLGAFHVIKAALPLLRKSTSPRIVNLSSGASSITQRSGRRYAYGASKAGLNHLTRGLAQEWEQEGICVVALSPGWVKTDMGGLQAELEPSQVASDLERTLRQLNISHSGKFLDRFGKEGVYQW